MAQTNVSSRRSRIALLSLGFSALLLALPFSAHADGKHHGKRHGNHSRNYYSDDDRHHHHYYGPPHWRGPKRVKVYNHYYPVPVPVAVPVYPAYPQAYPDYPQDYDRYDSKPVVRIGVDWVIGF